MDDESPPELPPVGKPAPPNGARLFLLSLVVLLCVVTLLPLGLMGLIGSTDVGRRVLAIHGMELVTGPAVLFGVAWTAMLVAFCVAYSARSSGRFWLVWLILLGLALLNTGGCVTVLSTTPFRY